MQTKMNIVVLMLLFFLNASCKANNTKEEVVVFETNFGIIKVKLYPETSLHKQNFLKLVDQKFYDGLLFHRVIADFMVQAGDPDSKNAQPGQMIGAGDVGYTIPGEFIYPQYFHKKGTLAAARQGDDTNPTRASSGCQFYFVVGRKFTDLQLQKIEARNKDKYIQQAYKTILSTSEEYKIANSQNDETTQRKLMEQAMEQALAEADTSKKYLFSEAQKMQYTSVGGTPHLDGQYTVFGEVIEGIEVVENISKTKVGVADRPIEDIVILKARRD